MSFTFTGISNQSSATYTYVDANGLLQTSVITSSLAAASSNIQLGGTTTLTPTFNDGTASIDNGIGVVSSGVGVSVSPTTTTTYTLTISSPNGSISSILTIGVIQLPAITSFQAANTSIAAGTSTTLTAVFTGTGTIDNGIGAVVSGVPITVSPILTTIYTLTASNSLGASSTATTTVSVVNAPIITSFTASSTSITSGGSTTLTPVFAGGTGAINGIGNVVSGVGVNVSPTASTTYTLSVSNIAGTTSSSITINVSTGLPCMNLKLAQGMNGPVMTAMAKPTRGVVYPEPNFGTCMVRATDHAADGLNTFARNDYSRRQAFNADGSLYLEYAYDGSWYIYDQKTYKMIKVLPGVDGDAECQWHPTDPALLYYLPINGGLKLYCLNVNTLAQTTAADFTGKTPWSSKAAHIWTRSEGSPSKDARYWGFQVEDASFNTLGYIVWDIVANSLVGSMPVNSWGRPDHCSMTPSGRWIVISWDSPGGTWAYSPDFKTKKQLHTTSEHSDLAIGANGHDYYVSIDYSSNAGSIFMFDIDAGVRTDLIPTYINGDAAAFHISGKAFNKPGWVVVGAYAEYGPAAPPWYNQQIFILELAANPRVYGLAYHRSYDGDYFCETHCSPNRDLTRLAFNSNWNNTTTPLDVETYQLILSPTAFP